MALASSLQKTASKLVSKFGGTVAVITVSAGAYNTSTGAITETTTTLTIKGVLDGISTREVSGLVQATDKRLTVAAVDLTAVPTTADRVTIGGIVHQIITVEKIEQDNQVIIYTFTLRA